MTDQEKPKITITFTERRNNLVLSQLKAAGKFYLIVVIAVALPEAFLDLTGIAKFSFPEALIDFFVLTCFLIALLFFTLPIMHTQTYRRRSMAALRVRICLVAIQITALVIFYFAFPDLHSLAYFEVFVISEIIYQTAFVFITNRYKFNRKYFSIQMQNGIKIRKGLDGYVESIERSDFMTQELRNTIEDKIKGKISEEQFLEAISGLEPYKREIVISMISGIESRLRKRYRW